MKQEDIIETITANIKTRGPYRCYKDAEKEKLFELVYLKGYTVHAVALKLHIVPRTANNWVNTFVKEPKDYFERKSGSGRPVGRPPILDDSHKDFLTNMIDENTDSLTLDIMMESLIKAFEKIDSGKMAFYNFVTKKCSISLKRAHFYTVERNTPERILERYEWVKHWMKTDIDYLTNCVFIDEAAFHINLKRTFSWFRKGEKSYCNGA